MTLEELLKAAGLDDEAVTKTIEAMKENKLFIASEENLDIRYNKLKTDHEALQAKSTESENLIAELKKATKDDESLQAKVTEYEAAITAKDEELKATKINNAVQIALLKNKATDIDYLTFKLKEAGELELDDNGEVKGLDDKLAELKTKFPAQFDSANGGAGGEVVESKLPDVPPAGDTAPKDLASAIAEQYKAKE